jgi:SNF2 family DNA or RNA helicase
MLECNLGLWWQPGCGKTLALAKAGEAVGERQLWLTTLQLLRDQTAADLPGLRSDDPCVQVLTGSKDIVNPQADVVVACYDTARTEAIWRQLYALRWGSMALDEAHALANTAAKRTAAVYGARQDSKGSLFRRSDFCWPSTGTPVLNNPMDLWSHASRLWPAVIKDTPTKAEWMNRYCVVKQGDFGLQVVGGQNLSELRAKMAPHVDIRLLSDVAPNLPALTVDEMAVEIGPKERAQLAENCTPDQLRQVEILLAELDGGEAAAEMALQGLMLQLSALRRVLANAKAWRVAELVKEELRGGLDRCIVFGHHQDALATVATELKRFGGRLLNGQTNAAYRAQALREFAAGDCRVIVCNTGVAGTGLNLQHCRRIVFLESSWTPAQNHQAIARCHRAGQTRPVHVTFTSVPRSIDHAVAGVLTRKARMINTLMED